MDVAVDIVVFAWDRPQWKILLIQRGHEPFKDQWALPGGFVDDGEDLVRSATRELREETGVLMKHPIQVGAYGDPGRDPRKRVVSIAYAAVLDSPAPAKADDDARDARWFSLDEIPSLAFDHNIIVSDALVRFQEKYHLNKHLPANGPLPMAAIHSFMDTFLKV